MRGFVDDWGNVIFRSLQPQCARWTNHLDEEGAEICYPWRPHSKFKLCTICKAPPFLTLTCRLKENNSAMTYIFVVLDLLVDVCARNVSKASPWRTNRSKDSERKCHTWALSDLKELLHTKCLWLLYFAF